MAKKKYTTKVLENYKKILVSELKKELNKPGSNLEKSIVGRKLPKRDGFVISMNEYGLNVDRGRSAGKFPPIEKINDWIDRKDIKPKTLRIIEQDIGLFEKDLKIIKRIMNYELYLLYNSYGSTYCV